jgi:hypothetical protein
MLATSRPPVTVLVVPPPLTPQPMKVLPLPALWTMP